MKKNNSTSSQDKNKEKKLHDEYLYMGKGDDTHQRANKGIQPLTTQQGTTIADDQNSLKVGQKGPALLEDFIFRDKLFHFDHERIPERVVHARGFGVHGYFENYDALPDITCAQPFQKKGTKTPAFVRFSTVAGSKGSPDLARDVRGFAVKLYTEAGNWDIVGNNIPVFFIQDAIKFPDVIHAAKEAPDRGFPQAQTAHDNFWDFISLTPESMHMVMWIMSDRAIPRSFRFMEGFGVHTFRLVNKEGKATFVKFHWKPKLGLQSVTWDEALQINGADPDYHRRDLWNAIQSGHFPEWELGLQLFDDEFCKKFPFDVLDATKLIPEEEVPVKIVGRLVLNRCVDNFFAETEQVAFCTQNIIPGVEFTDDPLLQGRNFSYLDTQLKRLGSPNFTHLPINAPKCPFANFQQDGHMAFYNPKGRANYNPNSWHDGPRENPAMGFHTFPEIVSQGKKERVRPESFADHYSQARQFYISQTPIEQEHMANALVFELSKVEKEAIRERTIGHLLNIDEILAKKVANELGIKKLPSPCEAAKPTRTNLKPSRALSILQNAPKSFAGRRVGILIEEGANATLFKSLLSALKKEKAFYTLISLHTGHVILNDGQKIVIDEKIDGAPSVLFDSIVILLKPNETVIKKYPKVYDFIMDAYFHYKYIGYDATFYSVLEKIHRIAELDKGFIALDKKATLNHYIESCRHLRVWDRKTC